MHPLLIYLLVPAIIILVFLPVNYHTKWIRQNDLEDIGPLLILMLMLWPVAVVIAIILMAYVVIKKYLFPK